MFKIKLLILLFSFILFSSCVSNHGNKPPKKVSLDYIGGGEDGLVLKNMMTSYLQSFDILDSQSNFIISANIRHKSNTFITNIDNTADRFNISSTLNIKIIDNKNNCKVLEYNDFEEQFFISAISIYYTSNNKAISKIKEDNTEILTRNFINELLRSDLICMNE